jgi:predicted ATPase/DNA-binding CsgD family transcriptional regulator
MVAGSRRFPLQPTPLIGREADITAAGALLSRSDVRLVTLTGPGGVGKTRLALALAERLSTGFDGGVTFVDLAPLSDAAQILSEIARALGLPEGSDRPLAERLADFIGGRRLLLVLDNCEHLPAAVPDLASLLGGSPGLVVLATSRAALGTRWEHVYPVAPLTLPEDGQPVTRETLSRYAATALFVARAAAVVPEVALTEADAPAIAAICRRLDGLPLAIKLAAARTRVLTPAAILDRLDRRLSLLTGGSSDLPARQRTLRATIAWSHDLLDDDERALFRRLAVFAGGCTLAAVEAVGADAQAGERDLQLVDRLAALVAKSLVQRQAGAAAGRGVVASPPLEQEPRFTMLQTIREYALERLEASGEADAHRRRHAAHFLAVAEEAEPELRGGAAQVWAARLDADLDNLRAALGWCVAHGEAEEALRLAGALDRFWILGGYLSEGRRWLESALACPGPASDRARAQALYALGHIYGIQDDYEQAVSALEESLRLYRLLGGVREVARGLANLGRALVDRGDVERAAMVLDEGLILSRALEDRPTIALVLHSLGRVAEAQGELERAADLLEQSLALERRAGDRLGMAAALDYLGMVCQSRREYARAVTCFEESLALYRAAGDRSHLAVVLRRLAVVQLGGREVGHAALLGESLALHRELGTWFGTADCLLTFGALAGQMGRPERAARLFGVGEAVYEARQASLPPAYRGGYARAVAGVRQALGEAAYAEAQAAGGASPLDEIIAEALALKDEALAAAGRPSAFSPPPSPLPDGLTAREADVLRLLAAGRSNREIAAALVVSVRTVEHHVAAVYAKIGAHRRVDAAAYARRHGLLPHLSSSPAAGAASRESR